MRNNNEAHQKTQLKKKIPIVQTRNISCCHVWFKRTSIYLSHVFENRWNVIFLNGVEAIFKHFYCDHKVKILTLLEGNTGIK